MSTKNPNPRARANSMVFCGICDQRMSRKNFLTHKKRHHSESVSDLPASQAIDAPQLADANKGARKENLEKIEAEERDRQVPLSVRANPRALMPPAQQHDPIVGSLAAENAKLKAELKKCQIQVDKWMKLYYRVDEDNASLRKRLRGNPVQWLQEDQADPPNIHNGHVDQQDVSNKRSASFDEQPSVHEQAVEDEIEEPAPLPAEGYSLRSSGQAQEDHEESNNALHISPMKVQDHHIGVEDSDSSLPLAVNSRRLSSISGHDSSQLSDPQSMSDEPEEVTFMEDVKLSSAQANTPASARTAAKKRKRGAVTDSPSRVCRYCDKNGMDQDTYDEHMKTNHPDVFRPPSGPSPHGGRLECDTCGWVARLSWKRHWEKRHHGLMRPEKVWFRDEQGVESRIFVEVRNRKQSRSAKKASRKSREDSSASATDELPTDVDMDVSRAIEAQSTVRSETVSNGEKHIIADHPDNGNELKGEWAFLNDQDFQWEIVKREGAMLKSPFHSRLDFPFAVAKSDMWNKLSEYTSVTVNQTTYTLNDDVYVYVYNANEEPHNEPARLAEIRALDPSHVYMRVHYYYRHDGVNLPPRFREMLKGHPDEVVATSWTQILGFGQLNGKVVVERWEEGAERPRGEGVLYWRWMLNVWEEEGKGKKGKKKVESGSGR